jgi:formyltetrahydrofolate deformylase
MVSQYGHCLSDLLFRKSTGALNIEVPAIVSSHRDAEPLARSYGIPFHRIPVAPQTKADAEARLLELVERFEVDLVVFARCMRTLSGDLCARLDGRAINIHHSSLPGVKGARPCLQAHRRGVKPIGATAHCAAPGELITLGRDVGTQVPARAVQWRSEGRVLLNGHHTVVFR